MGLEEKWFSAAEAERFKDSVADEKRPVEHGHERALFGNVFAVEVDDHSANETDPR